MDFLSLIPHRPPFLFIDAVDELNETKIKAQKTIQGTESFFQGHYPDFPLVPGVLLCEAIFQAGAVLISHKIKASESLSRHVPVVTKITNARFKQMVFPEESISIEAELLETVRNVFFLKGLVKVREKVAVRLEFTCALVPKEEK